MGPAVAVLLAGLGISVAEVAQAKPLLVQIQTNGIKTVSTVANRSAPPLGPRLV